ncbi:MAG: (d)CMP kinase [Hyphomicrobiaceae bacterium]|nr:(d)CMP kinase [Hyphomicrobiaceae bacterium]MCC0023964.1 (d)CMP kinase [Hyphomicrobiaceae bacterium]
MRIAIDGPAASGKGTIAKGLAKTFNLPHLDTGLLYRAVGLTVRDVPELNFEEEAIAAARSIDPSQLDPEKLGRAKVAKLASRVARIPKVREALRDYQVNFANQPGGAVLDGRDIGTTICPDAEVKIFVTASPETRARRRADQMASQGYDIGYDEMLRQIESRDEADRNNPAGAFYVADEAHLLDTSQLDIEAALRAAIAIVNQAMAGQPGSE